MVSNEYFSIKLPSTWGLEDAGVFTAGAPEISRKFSNDKFAEFTIIFNARFPELMYSSEDAVNSNRHLFYTKNRRFENISALDEVVV